MFCTECGKEGKIKYVHTVNGKMNGQFCTRKCAIDYVFRMGLIEKAEE